MTNNITDLTNNPFTNITYNLAGLSGGQLRAITLFDDTPTTAGDSIPVVGGLGGVYRLLGTQWTRYGQGLPNTVVEDVQYEPSNDLLIAGTFGRGVWEVQNVSTSIASTLAPSPAQPVVNTVEASLFPIPVLAPPLFNNGKVASYTDANPASTIADFTATIDWGDGTPMTAGTISQPGGVGTALHRQRLPYLRRFGRHHRHRTSWNLRDPGVRRGRRRFETHRGQHGQRRRQPDHPDRSS